MNFFEFGTALLDTLDLDPLYVALAGARQSQVLTSAQLGRWCIAYWMTYHAGAATSLCQETANFWPACIELIAIPSGPRGAERRHYRGAKAVDATRWLAGKYPNPVLLGCDLSQKTYFRDLTALVQEWPQFGPWIAFKIADMSEQVLGNHVEWCGADLAMYEEPLKGGVFVHLLRLGRGLGDIATLRRIYQGLSKHERAGMMGYELSEALIHFNSRLAPPHNRRRVGIPEVETMFCKFKAHLGGHYPIGKDTKELAHHFSTAGRLGHKIAQFLPKENACSFT